MDLGPEPRGPGGESVAWTYFRCPNGHGFVGIPANSGMPLCSFCFGGPMEPWVRRASTIYIHPDGEMPPPLRRTIDRGTRLMAVSASEERLIERRRRRA